MKNNKELKMIFDATILGMGEEFYGNRTGIYFVALNLLKQFAENPNIKLYIYCEHKYINYANKLLAKIFTNKEFKIISNKHSKIDMYNSIKEVRNEAKENKEYFIKNILQTCLIIIKTSILFEKILHRNKTNLLRYDVYFSPRDLIPESYCKLDNLKRFILLYDIIPLVLKDSDYANALKIKSHWFAKLLNSLNSKDYYFSISQYTKQDFLRYFPQISEEKFVTTPIACDKKYAPATINEISKVRKKYNIPDNKKYIFSLCKLEPRKNLLRIVRTFIEFIKHNKLDDIVFVLGGGHVNAFINEINKEVESFWELKDKIIQIGYVNDEDLAPLYSGAEWFVFTSQYEGFGLPPLEAMSCGCPVITSNNSSLPEVVGDAGIMIDWDSDEQHIEAYEKYYFNKELRKEYAQKGLERSKQFSWEKCANIMIEKMLEVCQNEK